VNITEESEMVTRHHVYGRLCEQSQGLYDGPAFWTVIVTKGGKTTIAIGNEVREHKTLKRAKRDWSRKNDPVRLRADINRVLGYIWQANRRYYR